MTDIANKDAGSTNTRSADTNNSAIGLAFHTMQDELLRFVRRRIDDPDIADDLIQDVFTKALTSSLRRSTPDNLRAWLYTVARTTIIDYYRKRTSRTTPGQSLDNSLLNQLPADETRNPTQAAQQLATCLTPLLQGLPAIYRDTLIASDLNGQTLATIAKQEAVSVSAIKSRASRGRVMLRAALLDCCDIDRDEGEIDTFSPRPGADRCPPPGCG